MAHRWYAYEDHGNAWFAALAAVAAIVIWSARDVTTGSYVRHRSGEPWRFHGPLVCATVLWLLAAEVTLPAFAVTLGAYGAYAACYIATMPP
jgi:hypothetical protein